MFVPGIHSESETYAGYTIEIVDGLTAAAFGLNEEQARATPTASALSIGGIVKHCTYGLRQYATRLTNPPMPAPEDMAAHVAEWEASFALTSEETLAGAVQGLAEARDAFLAEVGRCGADEPGIAPPAPWFGLDEPTEIRNRHLLGHVLLELARHAGHADIIREQIDGEVAEVLAYSAKGIDAPSWSID